jgi:hypothetical protein
MFMCYKAWKLLAEISLGGVLGIMAIAIFVSRMK